MKKLIVIAAVAVVALTAASANAASPRYIGCSPESAALRVCYHPAP